MQGGGVRVGHIICRGGGGQSRTYYMQGGGVRVGHIICRTYYMGGGGQSRTYYMSE